MEALHFGAGNIGRGFIGKLLSDAGLNVTFADVNDEIISQLQARGEYDVKIVGQTEIIEKVTNVAAINSKNNDQIIDKIASVDLITTAVGPNVLKIIASSIAQGIEKRFANENFAPLNIIACENMVKASTNLKAYVLEHLNPDLHTKLDEHIGFVDSAVDRIVPPSTNEDVLAVTVEEFSEWIVDQTQFKGDIPTIAGMELTDNLMAFIERKLFTLNTGHCITAYLGFINNHKTILDAISDDDIYQDVKGAMNESGAVLIQRYGFNPEKHAQYIEKILGRFANPYLVDEVDRVGRQPIRKLGKNERLIKPILGTIEYSLPCDNLLKGVATSLLYVSDEDPQAIELQTMLQDKGVIKTLSHYTELPQDSELLKQAEEIYDNLI